MIPERFLPLGSVVTLKDAKKSIMIIGYGFTGEVDNSTKVFDYCACLYPEGFLDPNKSILFDHESIEKVDALGFDDERGAQWRKFFSDNLDNIKKQFENGEADLSNLSVDNPNLSTYISVDELEKQKQAEAPTAPKSAEEPNLSTYISVDELEKQKQAEAPAAPKSAEEPNLSTYITVDELEKQKAIEEGGISAPNLSTYITVEDLEKQKAEEAKSTVPNLSTYITVDELERQKAEETTTPAVQASDVIPNLSTYITVDELEKQKAEEGNN